MGRRYNTLYSFFTMFPGPQPRLTQDFLMTKTALKTYKVNDKRCYIVAHYNYYNN